MKRILIIGNSGSGKSWLAARLAEQLTIREVNLDTIVWQPGGFNQKRPQHEIDHAIQTLAQEPSWVVEGVFGALAEQLLDAADTLLFLISTGLYAVIHCYRADHKVPGNGIQWQPKRAFNNCWCGHRNMGSEPVKAPANSIASCLIDSQTTSTVSRLGQR